MRCDPAAAELTIQGGTNGVLVDSGLRVNGGPGPRGIAALPDIVGRKRRRAGAQQGAGADRRGAYGRLRGHGHSQRRHDRRR